MLNKKIEKRGFRFFNTFNVKKPKQCLGFFCFYYIRIRLARDFDKDFGDNRYATEELVAELGAVFLFSELGITQ